MYLMESRRVNLRYFKKEDISSFQAYRADPAVRYFQGWPEYTLEMAEEFVREMMNLKVEIQNKWIQIAVEEKSSQFHIGDVAFINENGQVKIGYTIAETHQGKGYGSEAVTALLDMLFNRLKVHRVTAIVDIDNIASIALLEKLHFRREAHYRESYYDHNLLEYRDEYLYALLHDEWSQSS
ncbi:MAG: GNAT family N-acetyltransferase [Candidatus Heimdallarchaeota archaeon]|nr:GNAT family N-acetyltransferase [Candidatus Heimdallarchaeota archaeon]